MPTTRYIPINKKQKRTYVFTVVVEQDEDVWSAYCPTLLQQGAATWGYTREEAIGSISEVAKMVVESLVDHGELVPEDRQDKKGVSTELQVAVTA